METGENSPLRSLDLSDSWPQVKEQFEHEAALYISVPSVRLGHIAEVTSQNLKVSFLVS